MEERSILNPELVWIENRCYRKLPIKGGETNTYDQEDIYPTQLNEHGKEENDEGKEHEDLPIKHDGNKFWISIYVAGPLMGMVCGRQHQTKKRIEEQTHTVITFPAVREGVKGRVSFHKNARGGDVVITGGNKNSVSNAYRRIEDIVYSGRWKVTEYTHFISIPLNNDSIQAGFQKFKEDVLTSCKSARGVSDDLFEFPSTLHLTISMLTLFDERDKELAKAVLNKCKGEILDILGDKKLHVQVRGIEYMNDDPGEVDVLYGKVREIDDDNSLQIIAEKLTESLIEVNLSRKEYNLIKLHVTLMKSRREGNERITFDARPLLKRYADYVFGEIQISEIHISTRYTGKQNSYYTPAAVITLQLIL